jgi:hypothetical protein
MYKLSDDGLAVMVKKDGKWKVKYRHKTKKEAQAQLRALYANDPHAKAGKEK